MATEEEYLRLERAAETKSEFVGGEIVPRPGGPLVRPLIAAKWSAAVRARLGDAGKKFHAALQPGAGRQRHAAQAQGG